MFVSPFLPTDDANAQYALATAFNQSTRADTYSSSIAYYMLTARKGGRIYTDGQSYIVIAKHPHIEDCLMVFPEINGNGSLTVKILGEMDEPKNGIQLARYTYEDLSKLQQASSLIAPQKEIVAFEIEEDAMDWKYPVHILDTVYTGNLVGKRLHPVRNKFNGAENRLTTISLDAPNAIKAMRAAVLFWAAAMIYHNKETGHNITEFYDTLIAAMEKQPDLFDGFVTFDGDEPAGFTIWEKGANGTANGLAGLSRRSIKGMSEYQTVTACRRLASEGIMRYNIGGSETANLDHHKRLYAPIESFSLNSFKIKIINTLTQNIRSLPIKFGS